MNTALSLCNKLWTILTKKNSSVHEYNTRNRNKPRPVITKHVYRDKDFRFVSVHVGNFIFPKILALMPLFQHLKNR